MPPNTMNRKPPWLALIGAFLIAVAAAQPSPADDQPSPADDPPVAAEETPAAPESNAEAQAPGTPDDAPEIPSPAPGAPARTIPEPPEGGWDVYVVPINGTITSPQLFILRRALKDAIKNDVEVVLLDMDTPGGAAGVMLEMMEALDKFPGDTITYVNDEAISAGAFIAVATDDIWFNPRGTMGAAAVVMANGQEVPVTMQAKIDSLIDAKVRMMAKEYRYRADVMRAMSQLDYQLEIDGEVIESAKEGKLLTLTADEAVKLYGDPPQPLLAEGVAGSVEDLLNQKLGTGNYEIRKFEVTWSEEFAKWFKNIAPICLGLGILLMYFEAQTPTFGAFGFLGVCLLLLVFASNYFAGMAGNEPVILFAIGVLLIAVELFVVPGTVIAGLAGLLLVFGSLIWAMADIWPAGAEDFEITPMLFYRPIGELAVALLIAGAGIFLALKMLPQKWLHRSIILGAEVGDPSPVLAGGGRSIDESRGGGLPEPGARGIATTDLHPGGTVEIDGCRFQARLAIGSCERGAAVEVLERRDFSLVVKPI